MLSQNHSWNGLTRPARINDNLPPAVAGSPEQRCRVDSQPGTLVALRTQPGHERGVPGAARWVCGGIGRQRGVIGDPGNQVAHQWGGGREEALADFGESSGAPGGCAPHSRHCGHSRSAQPGPSGPGWRSRGMSGSVCKKFQTCAGAGAQRSVESGAGAPEPTEGRPTTYLPAKCEKESGTLHKATPRFLVARGPRGQAFGGWGEGTARNARGAREGSGGYTLLV